MELILNKKGDEMELVPPLQRKNGIKNNKNKHVNNGKTTNFIKDKNVKIYHPPKDELREKMIEDLSLHNNGNRNVMSISPASEIVSSLISYAKLANLRKKGKLSKEEYLNAKAIKAGFKDQYERVLTRYSECVKLYKENNFKNAKDRSKMFGRMHAMEQYLKKAEKLKEKSVFVISDYIESQARVMEKQLSC